MNHRAPSISALAITVEVLQARDLIAKDRSLLGQRTTSDPYVKVKFRRSSTQQTHCSEMGQTSVASKTLNPVWSGEKFQYTLGGSDAIKFLRYPSTSNNGVMLTLWDEDVLSEDDVMGTMYIPLVSGTSILVRSGIPLGKVMEKNTAATPRESSLLQSPTRFVSFRISTVGRFAIYDRIAFVLV